MSPRSDRTPRQRLSVDQRRARLLAAARRLFAQRSYAEVSMAEVAAAADASTALAFHYFGSKAALYAAVVAASIEELRAAQLHADAELDPGASSRDRVRTGLLVWLDHLGADRFSWATALRGGEEPSEVIALRRDARAAEIERLQALLRPAQWARHDYALWGYYGFLDQVCLRWIERGCPEDERHSLIDTALGALEGALGDWGS